ncbi:hypothetical protein DV451_002057 [Geotrichum candidum]|uniref:TATA-binding protein interacting (TIP20) domain-containing protein n=1 Tax=Geotrichum candidum TaxID=1173061 RepID=A0A9P5G7T1_GEOCN|nr:hypothetical protein DV451_002057 [Geotrichum candidum]KAF5108456.1 hypothetical protein DV453_002242 [Geotrichum candidum]
MYIQLGLPNLSPADQAALLPDIVKDIAKASPKNASTIFGILLKILAQWSPPERGSTAADQLRSELGFDKRPEDAAFLAEAFTNLFLLDLTPLLNQSASATTTDKPLSCRSPGLGFEQYEFLTRNHAGTFSGNNALHEAKRNALKLLLAGSAFTEEELYFPLLVASLDKNSAINSQAETPFKKLKVNLEDKARVRYLYRLVLGDLENGVLPATEVIKARAVQILGKSVLAANIDPLAIVNAAITSDYSKCVQAGFAFIRWVSKHASQEIIAAISNQLVDAMMDWITKTGWPQLPVADNNKLGPVRSLAYEAIGSIISRNPTMITDLKKFRFLLEALEKDTASMKPSIQESLSEILPAVEYLPDNVRVELRELLFRYLLDPHSDDSCKYVAVKFAVRAYPFSDAAARVICLLAMARTNRSDVLEEAKRTVSEETQLFEPGVLNTGDGSVSTYKDILNLASELGDPGLIYKFMALAGHSALWSSRKGAAFGLGSILSKANLDEMMENNQRLSKSLIPKLYRYKFDSNPSVQQAMQGIWDSLVKDKSAAINDNFDDILEELLKGMGDKEWRVRQASTAALSDLLQGRPIELYQDKLERIWMMSFRAVDDIKESVRNAGLQLTRGLATTLIRHVDTSTGTSPARATALLEHLVPFLMGNFGLQSEAQEVQSFALETIINLCKKGGAALKPFIPGLVEELLVLMSTLEPQAMNYLALNADKYGLTHNAIDASRLASVRGSPIMEAVEQMVDQAIDDKTMGLLVPRLAAAIKKSVGLPSKVGASRVLVALTIRHLQGAGPYADTLLTSAAGQLGDRNDTISQSYATATGYLCRIASDKAVLKYIARLKTLYFGTDEASRPRLIAGFAVNALSKHAPETFSRLASTILPFVYVAKHDADKAVQKVFDTVWSDNTGGSGAVRLYLPEIMALAGEQLAEQRQWGIRQVAAQSVADASNLIGDERLPREEFSRLLNILFDACVGRSWSGKELVLMALVRLVERAPNDLLADGSLLARANKVVLTEARRKNKTYQIKALASLAEYLVAFPQAELYEAMFDLAEPYLEPPSESDSDVSSDDDSTNRNKGRRGEDVEMRGTEGYNNAKYKQRLKTRNAVLEAVASAFVDPAKQRMAAAGAQPLSQEEAISVLVRITSTVTSAITQFDSLASWETKLLVCSIYAKLVAKLIALVANDPNEGAAVQLWITVKPIWDTVIFKHFTDARDASSHEKVRVEAARCGGVSLDLLAAATSLPGGSNAAAGEFARVKGQLENLRTIDASDVVKTELTTVLDKPRS